MTEKSYEKWREFMESWRLEPRPLPTIEPEDYVDELRDALEGMVTQFGYWSDAVGGYWTGGLSALEQAFDALGWEDPHPYPPQRCDEPDCLRQATMGTPSPAGYRRTCYEHRPQWELK